MSIPDSDFTREFFELTPEQQAQVLGFIRGLQGRPEGTPASSLLKFVGLIPPGELALMTQAIAEGCEQVNHDQW